MTENALVQAVDWTAIDWVLLDMDGTLLDLRYDNWFWREHIPAQYAAARGISHEQAVNALAPEFRAVAHTLPWYCTDYWSRITGLDVAGLKRESRDRIGVLDGTVDFLSAVQASGRPLWLVTNAHRDSWQVKIEHTGLGPYFDRIVCSHDFGAPKESQDFWNRLRAQHDFDPEHALFADDSLPVLQGAATFGIGQIRAIACPERDGARREIRDFAWVDRLSDLLPIPPCKR